ncbi:MAG: hypothetical protein LBD47_11655 [Treponema sp.]|nr:hypothetical protein [Treponema sp.]
MAAASSSGVPGSAKLNGKIETGQVKKKRKKERSAQAGRRTNFFRIKQQSPQKAAFQVFAI